ncbi:MAG: hypothetical protein KKD39_08110 [Candidatus Altiarchaeota archaeon]|nr:hypothetical protein [Candidatus Altiarchaeota archaeon]
MAFVVKVGGSLTKSKKVFDKVVNTLIEASVYHDFAIVVGGGELADAVRQLDKRLSLGEQLSHEMALHAMDAMALMLARQSKKFKLVDVEDAKKIRNKIPVLQTAGYILKSDMDASWDNTSDSVAAYAAGKLDAKELILLKDVDGVLHKKTLQQQLSVKELKALGETCVDRNLHKYLRGNKLRCIILNGRKPERLRNYMRGGVVYGTVVDCI